MRLYVVRHGETTYNVENRICGISNVELTDKGRKQAFEAGKKLKDIHFDHVYVSPLKRAIDTANLLTKGQYSFHIDKRIEEINFGIFEGMPRDTKAFQETKYHLGMRYVQGETFLEVIHRVYSFLDEIKESDDENVLIVCHGGIIRAIHSYFYDMSNDDFYHFTTENCAILEYVLK